MNNTLVCGILVLFSFGLPIGLIIYWKKKTKVSISAFLAGYICFALFALLFEQLLHTFCLTLDNPVSRFINNNALAYVIYATLAAGIFEESGRLFGFKVLLKKNDNVDNSIAYGIGHGGVETIILLGTNYLLFFLILIGIPFGDEATTSELLGLVNQADFSLAWLAMLERLSAMMIQIGLSVIVYNAVYKKEIKWYFLAILLHALCDLPAAIYQKGFMSLAICETITFVFAIVLLINGIKLYKSFKTS